MVEPGIRKPKETMKRQIVVFGLLVSAALPLMGTTPTVIWEVPLSRPVLEVRISENGEHIAALDAATNVNILTRNGEFVGSVLVANPFLDSRSQSMSFNSSNELVVWQSPATIRWIDPQSAVELRQASIPIPPNPDGDEARMTRAMFSPGGKFVACGWMHGKEFFIGTTAGGVEHVRFNNASFSTVSQFAFGLEESGRRLLFHRRSITREDTFFEMIDLVGGSSFVFPYLLERCTKFDSTDGFLTVDLVDRTAEGEVVPICKGENLVSPSEIWYATFSPTGEFLQFRGGIVNIGKKELYRFNKTREFPGGFELPALMFLNASETEAFGVWENDLIAGYDLSVPGQHEEPLVEISSIWDSFNWFSGSISPKRDLIVLQTVTDGSYKLVAIENPFRRPILREPKLEGGKLRIRWAGGGGMYRISVRSALDSGTWEAVSTTSNRFFDIDPLGRSNYFRVELVQ